MISVISLTHLLFGLRQRANPRDWAMERSLTSLAGIRSLMKKMFFNT